MIKKITVIISLYFVAISLFVSCSKSSSSEEPPLETLNPPAKVVGVLPWNGEPCSDFETVPNEELKISVLFRWKVAQFAKSYILVISDGANEVARNTYTTLETNEQLDRGKTYAWTVTSINTDGETSGDTYSFTTSGVPVGNYAPYAADISVDFDSNTSLMLVSWIGADEDGDDLTYDVNVFQGEELLLESLNINETLLDSISFEPDTNYIVEVGSKDKFGNYSISRLNITAPK